jgi:hypothetical protein
MSPAEVPSGAAMPFTAMLSLMVIGTPSIALSGLRWRHRSCEAAAIASAPAASMTHMALIFFSQASMRESAARVTSTGESVRVR